MCRELGGMYDCLFTSYFVMTMSAWPFFFHTYVQLIRNVLREALKKADQTCNDSIRRLIQIFLQSWTPFTANLISVLRLFLQCFPTSIREQAVNIFTENVQFLQNFIDYLFAEAAKLGKRRNDFMRGSRFKQIMICLHNLAFSPKAVDLFKQRFATEDDAFDPFSPLNPFTVLPNPSYFDLLTTRLLNRFAPTGILPLLHIIIIVDSTDHDSKQAPSTELMLSPLTNRRLPQDHDGG